MKKDSFDSSQDVIYLSTVLLQFEWLELFLFLDLSNPLSITQEKESLMP